MYIVIIYILTYHETYFVSDSLFLYNSFNILQSNNFHYTPNCINKYKNIL